MMANTAIIAGVLLVLIGVGGYFGSGQESLTALIPAAFGVLIGLLGVVARNESWRKHAMHAAAAFGTIGFIAAAGRLGMVMAKDEGSGLGLASLIAMALVCLVFVCLCIKSFVDARRRRSV